MVDKRKKIEVVKDSEPSNKTVINNVPMDEELEEFKKAMEDLKPTLNELETNIKILKQKEAELKSFSGELTGIFTSFQKSLFDIESKINKGDSLTEEDVAEMEKSLASLVKDSEKLKKVGENIK
jgi:chromosome segregation ATPase